MSSRITIDEARLRQVYEKTMDEIFMLFHYHPLSFPTDKLTARELGEIQQGLAEAKAAQASGQDMSRFDPDVNPKFANLRRTGR